MSTASLPLFPLRTVLFPDGVLSLKIFEPRYLSLIGRCLKDGGGFGVVLARSGHNPSSAADFHPFGTSCEITDWGQGDDKLLNIVAHGRRRFAVHATRQQSDGLIIGEVEYRDSVWGKPLSDHDAWLAQLVARMLSERSLASSPSVLRMDDAVWVSFRLCELMPLVLTQRQALLQMDDTDARLAVLRQAIRLIEEEDREDGET